MEKTYQSSLVQKKNGHLSNFLEPEDYQRKLQLIKRATLPKLNVSKGALNLESMGTVDFVTAFKMALDALNAINDPETGKPVLYGVQLQSYNLDEAVMNGLAVDQSLVAMNMKAQRVIYLWRMFEIAMNFDSSLVFGAKGTLCRRRRTCILK